jgi:hypothetical protein
LGSSCAHIDSLLGKFSVKSMVRLTIVRVFYGFSVVFLNYYFSLPPETASLNFLSLRSSRTNCRYRVSYISYIRIRNRSDFKYPILNMRRHSTCALGRNKMLKHLPPSRDSIKRIHFDDVGAINGS